MTDFSILIQDWYRLNKRDLPWRESESPYNIWISEIILQQTQVKQGLSYYYKFIEQYPNITDLANAKEDEVLRLWQGLGYYSRARNMHYAASQVLINFNGVFPTSHKDILSLKGVGDYTAAAVSSIAYNLPHAVVDGNVYRVLSRVFLINTPINSPKGKKEFSELAQNLLDVKQPGNHNQALMEIGALICKPKNPNCIACPLNEKCLAFSHQTMLNYPTKLKKIKIRNRYFNYFVITDKKSIVIKKREASDIWKGLYDFPLFESDKKLDKIDDNSYLDKEFKHILTHQHIFASFWIQEISSITEKTDELIIKIKDLDNYPLPQLLVKFLNQSDYFNR